MESGKKYLYEAKAVAAHFQYVDGDGDFVPPISAPSTLARNSSTSPAIPTASRRNFRQRSSGPREITFDRYQVSVRAYREGPPTAPRPPRGSVISISRAFSPPPYRSQRDYGISRALVPRSRPPAPPAHSAAAAGVRRSAHPRISIQPDNLRLPAPFSFTREAAGRLSARHRSRYRADADRQRSRVIPR